MHLERLQVARFRGFGAVTFSPTPGINVITGENGAGKTTLLEAVHLLGNGRSFRGRVRDGLIQNGKAELEVLAEWRERGGRQRRAGLSHTGRDWKARLDLEPVASLSELCVAFPVLSFEPGSHELIAGGSERRRQFIDWGLFHVEQDFLPLWRRYLRALKQRNALLKTRPRAALLRPWDREMAEVGEPMTQLRAVYASQLEVLLTQIAAHYLPELGVPRFEFVPGWRRDEYSLDDALIGSCERDLLLGHSSTGPHRADWRIDFERLPGRGTLSRGQEKLVALSCFLAQGQIYAGARGEWPIFALDDLASELDTLHLERVLQNLQSFGAQILLTGTAPPPVTGLCAARFHVEQGQIRTLL